MNRFIYLLAGGLALGLAAAPSGARAQTNEPWCGADHTMSTQECVYRTLPRCEEFMHPQGGYCVPNPRGGSHRD
jgi:hypothetical protein